MIGELSKAILDMSCVIEAEPENADALAVRGRYYGWDGQFEAAADDLQRAMNLDGQTPETVLLWAKARSQQRKLQSTTAVAPVETSERVESENKLDAEAIEASKQQAQEWFSRFVWPRTQEANEQGSTSPSTDPQREFGGFSGQ